jgi:hypothetical protein
VADTDPPRVCPRKLPKPASLRPGDALSLRHSLARRDSGGHNVQIAFRGRCGARIDLSVRGCPVRGRRTRTRATTAHHRTKQQIERTPIFRRNNLSRGQAARRSVSQARRRAASIYRGVCDFGFRLTGKRFLGHEAVLGHP